MFPKTYFPRSYFSSVYFGQKTMPDTSADLLRLVILVEQLIVEIRKTLNVPK